MQRLARTCYQHRRIVLGTWVVLLVGLMALASAAGGVFKVDFSLPGSESERAFDILKERGFGDRTGEQGQIVFSAEQGVDDPAVKTAMEQFFAAVEADVDGVTIVSPYTEAGARQIAQRGTIAYAEVNFTDRPSSEYPDAAKEILDLKDRIDVEGLRVEMGGDIFAAEAFGSSEGIGLLLAVIILLLAFGSVLAAGLPIATALFGIGCGIAIVQLVANVMNMPDFTTQAVLMIGIGVGIDYALFIVTRFREALASGKDPESAVVLALDTAGRAVLFAGTTVVIALLGLLVLNTQTFRGVAVGTTIGVLTTMAAALTLLPALLGFVGRNVDKLRLPHRKVPKDPTQTFWYRWSRVVQRRPWPAFLIALIVLLVLALPVFGLRLGFGDAGNRPTSDTTRQAYDTLSEGFGPGFNGPLLVVSEMPDGASDLPALQGLATAFNDTPGVAFATPPQPNAAGDAAIMQVFPATSPQDERTSDLVDRLRDDVIPDTLGASSTLDPAVGGLPAAVSDFSAYTFMMLPVVVGIVLLLSFLLLMVVFRSILVPLKAVVMNLLSVGVAYGLMVAVFQWGWGASLLGVGKEGPIEAWAPLMMFAVVFGLSMDYEVFLLSRIKEEYDRTGDNATAVADGLAVTARVITAAAAIMVCVFGAFVLGPDRALKLFGFGMAVAVLVDATIVRLILVPATMELLGDKNWWLPGWLDRILPVVHVEAHVDDPDAELAALTREEEEAASRP
jgi:putative drug exporter of the RND superfamily